MTANDRRDVVRGIAFLVLAAAIFGGVDGLSKALADTQAVAQIVWARYALGLPVLLATTPASGWGDLFTTRRLGLQVLRGCLPVGLSISMVLAVRYLPLAEATVILFAGPFLVVGLALPVLGERVRMASWIGVAVGFAAVVIVARPGVSALSRYTVFPLIAAFFYAMQQLATRRLGMSGERAKTTLAYTLAVGAILSTPVMILTWVPVAPQAWLLMIALGLVFGVSQLTMNHAFTLAPAGILAPFSYTQIVSAAVIGVLAFHDTPDIWTCIGIVMIVGAGIFVMRRA